MFSIEDLLSQGDKSLEFGNFPDPFDDQGFLNQDLMDFEFLDSFTGKSDPTDKDSIMNLDLKELLADVLAGESMDISLLNTNTVIPVSELSYNLNSYTLQGGPLEAVVPVEELSCEIATPVVAVEYPINDSIEGPGSAEVSSTTNTVLDLLDERNSLDSIEEPEEITESVAGKKYLEMRRKNNIASQKSRKVRKQINSKMSERLKELEKENKELSSLAERLETERNTLQELLMSIIAKKS